MRHGVELQPKLQPSDHQLGKYTDWCSCPP
jgi:hypothetical protein